MKENQPTLLKDLEDAFAGLDEHLGGDGGEVPTWLEQEWKEEGVAFSRSGPEVTKGHGRIEVREAWALSDPELNGYVGSTGTVGEAWPGVEQIVRVTRDRIVKGTPTRQTVYLVTSLTPEKATAKRLLAYNRAYWRIENELHYVRDETFGEDRSQIRSGALPQVMAGLRNLTLTLLRRAKHRNIAAALRTFAGRPASAIALVLNAHRLL